MSRTLSVKELNHLNTLKEIAIKNNEKQIVHDIQRIIDMDIKIKEDLGYLMYTYRNCVSV